MTTYERGSLVTLMTGLYGAMALPSGILSDRFGADTVITGFLLLTGGVFLVVPFVNSFAALAAVIAVGLVFGALLFTLAPRTKIGFIATTRSDHIKLSRADSGRGGSTT